MASLHVCASGHRWQTENAEKTVCPICTSIGTELLPPAPRSRFPVPLVPGFDVIEPLGVGGMGIVYKAKQQGLNRLVALKLIQPTFDLFTGKREEILARFKNEGISIARLSHPNVVQVHEVGEWQADDQPVVPYLAMEYVAGGTLTRRLTNGPLDIQAAAHLVETLAWAVQAAHEQGIVHRDLKPDNVLLTEEGVPKIADFGLARFMETADVTLLSGPTTSGQILGTPAFMAPEQARPGLSPLGPGADVWALGAILYACLTGRPPFLASSTLDTLQLVVEQDPVAPSRLNAQIPRDLETITLKCLRKFPQERYAAARDLADDLERFRQGKPVLARPLRLPVRAWRWSQRNPLVAASLLATLLTLLVGVTFVSLAWRGETIQRRQAEEALGQTRNLLEGVVSQVYDDLRLHDTGREPFPPKMASDVLNRLADYQDLLRQQEGTERELAQSIAWQGLLTWAAGYPDEAIARLERGVRLQANLDDLPADELARNLHALALMARAQRRTEDARRWLHQTRELARTAEQGEALLANVLHDLGRDALQHRQLPEAEKCLRESATIWERLSKHSPAHLVDRASVFADLGRVLAERGNVTEALKAFEQARGWLTTQVGTSPGNRRVALALSNVYHEMGRLILRPVPVGPERGEKPSDERVAALRQARQLFEQGKEVQASLARMSNEPVTAAWLRSELQRELLNVRTYLGQQQPEQAEKIMSRVLPLLEQFDKLDLGLDVTAELFRYDTYRGIALARSIFRRAECKAALTRALKRMKQLEVDPLPHGVFPRELGETAYLLAAGLRNVGLPEQAIPAARQAARWQRQVLDESPGDRDVRKELSRTLFELGGEFRAIGKHAEAAAVARERAALWPDDADELHDVACELCQCAALKSVGDQERKAYLDEAMTFLSKAVQAGLTGAESLRKEGDFTPLRNRPEFDRLVEQVEKRNVK